MTGRDLFSKYSFIIKLLKFVVKLIPKSLLELIYVLCDNSESRISLLFRYLYIWKYAKTCGDNIFIGKRVTLKNISSLILGDNISIHANCYLDAKGGIELGNNISIAHNSSLISFDHTWINEKIPIKYNEIINKKIKIESDVWIGCGCRILAGIDIGQRCVIAAGSVINKNVESKSLVGGVPGRKIKSLV
ncbi:acyltransferase [Peribacillus sp. TH27]|uniref:acyltransferase n=1 Tax=Peribacillus sp. TH27 TaxID=2798484 RepID=UPI0019146BBB|nr:acyltransferase [Peribacillus sp. TH27]MBK5462550.1 acyltransferase [Peribacillus sp. TH27]